MPLDFTPATLLRRMCGMDGCETDDLATLRAKLQVLQRKLDSAKRAARRRRTVLGKGALIASKILLGKSVRLAVRRVSEPLEAGQRVPATAIGDLIAAVFGRFVRVGIVAVVLALAPQALAIWQNVLIAEQNRYMQANNEFVLSQLSIERRARIEAFLADTTRESGLLAEDIQLLESLVPTLRRRIGERDQNLINSHPAKAWFVPMSRIRSSLIGQERMKELSTEIYYALEAFAEFHPSSLKRTPITVAAFEADIADLQARLKVLNDAIDAERGLLRKARLNEIGRYKRFIDEWRAPFSDK